MGMNYSTAESCARDYYNSKDAHNFYSLVWGGEDIHIGLYKSEQESIFEASRRIVGYISSLLDNLTKSSRILDMGSGFGGASRYLAGTYGCRVTSLNLSEVQNERHRLLNMKHGLDHLIEVIDGSFEEIPFPDRSFDIVWSQDAILHSGQRTKVIQEVSRVLAWRGVFIFTDPMQSDSCPGGVLQPILERIHLSTLGSPGFYRETARTYGLKEIKFQNLTDHLVKHYSRVLEETEKNENMLTGHISVDYIENMKRGLAFWVDGGEKGYLVWGIFHFQKTDGAD